MVVLRDVVVLLSTRIVNWAGALVANNDCYHFMVNHYQVKGIQNCSANLRSRGWEILTWFLNFFLIVTLRQRAS